MRRLLLFSLFGFIAIAVLSQITSKIPPHQQQIKMKMPSVLNGDELPIILNETNTFVKPKTSKDLGTPIGITYYDVQSNSNVDNRILSRENNVYTVWTFSPDSITGYPGRGTGINKSTNMGTNWNPQPTSRIEGTVRTGWPSVAKLSNGTLVVVSHCANPVQGVFSKSTDNGLSWDTGFIGNSSPGLQWPRMVAYNNKIHIIGNTNTNNPFQGFIKGAIVYLKSTDGGTNWSEPVIPAGLDTSNFSLTDNFADTYAYANKGDTIAIVYGKAFRTTCLVKSTNGGNTWAYKEIIHLPVKKFDTEGNKIFDINGDNQQDNLYSNDGCNAVVLDKYGKAHVFFGRMNFTDDGAGAGYNFYPFTDGLYYWNEDMGTIQYQYRWTMIYNVNTYEAIPDTIAFPIITSVYDIDSSGEIELPRDGFGPYYCSMSSMPQPTITPNGALYCYYSSIVERTDGVVGTERRAFRNIWKISKPPYGNWSTIPVRIAEDDNTEQVFPNAIGYCINMDFKNDIIYQGDPLPGNSIIPSSGNPHPIIENTIYYKSEYIENGCKPNNINENEKQNKILSVFPNPARDYINIILNLKQGSSVEISVLNIIGREVLIDKKNAASGESVIQLDIRKLPKGMYILKTTIGNEVYTNKLIIE